MRTLLPLGIALAAAGQALAQPAKLVEIDGAAKGIGYRHHASKVDAVKCPTHARGKLGNDCAL